MYFIYEVFDKYRTYTGRARRKEFWHFYLFVGIILVGLYIINGFLIESNIVFLFSTVFLTPMTSVAIRRVHDVGKNGWFLLIPIYNLVLVCSAGTKGDNKYGADPKQI
jgi:uncharacterized membrane protein YhaH (DUF805 family)